MLTHKNQPVVHRKNSILWTSILDYCCLGMIFIISSARTKIVTIQIFFKYFVMRNKEKLKCILQNHINFEYLLFFKFNFILKILLNQGPLIKWD